MTRKITNLKFWGRPMTAIRRGEWFIRLPIGKHETVSVVDDGLRAGYRFGNQPILWFPGRTVAYARNAAQRYLEKLAADIARESVKR